jgi:hypothetical protein
MYLDPASRDVVHFVNTRAESAEWRVTFQAVLCKYADEHFMSSLIRVPDELANDQDSVNVLTHCLNELRRVNTREFHFQIESVHDDTAMAVRIVCLRNIFYAKLAELNRLFVQFIPIVRFKTRRMQEEKLAERLVYRIEPSHFLPKVLKMVPIILIDFRLDLTNLTDSNMNLVENKFEIRPHQKLINADFDECKWTKIIERLVERYEQNWIVKYEFSLGEAFGSGVDDDDDTNDLTLTDFKKQVQIHFDNINESRRAFNYKFLDKKRELVVFGYREEATSFAEDFVKPELLSAQTMNTLRVVFTSEKHYKMYIMLAEFKGKYFDLEIFRTGNSVTHQPHSLS